MFFFLFIFFMTYIDFIRPEWIELPRITPSSTSLEITTPTSHLEVSEVINRIVPVTKSTIVTLLPPHAAAAEESEYEYDSRNSRSYEDSVPVYEKAPPLGTWKPKKWKSKPSPFSDVEAFDPTSYYKWRNASVAKVKRKPQVTDSVDYTILNPDIVPIGMKGELPKTVIIKSSTPLRPSGINQSVHRIGINGKLDTTPIDDDSDDLEEDLELINEETLDDDMENYESQYPIEGEEEDDDENEENYDTHDTSLSDDDEPQEVESNIAYQVQQPPRPAFSFKGFVDFLKNVQNNFLTKPANNMADKLKVLENLRDRIMTEVASRIQNLFGPRVRKQKRSMFAEKEHGIDFPSAEGALLTISFLTFAVFLIKLVLQVIYSIKYKYVYNQGVTQVAAIKSKANARKFSLSEEDHLKEAAKVLAKLS